MIDSETGAATAEDAAKPGEAATAGDTKVTVADASPAPKRPPMIVTCKC